MSDLTMKTVIVCRMKKVKTLVVMGLITRACVLNTVMSAFNHG